MKSLDIVFGRKSCRNFSGEPLRKRDMDILLEALRRAPSAGNAQPWFFYAIKNKSLKKGLAEAAYGQNFFAKAPVVFVICTIPRISSSAYGKRGGNLNCIQDTAAAAENLLITATALGYGSCWVGPGSVPPGEPMRREIPKISAIID